MNEATQQTGGAVVRKVHPGKSGFLQTAAGLMLLSLLALGLRLWGLEWGLPGPDRYYPYHPDEAVLLHALCSVNPLWGDVTPGFYNYGSGLILMTRLAYDLGAPLFGWGAVPQYEQPFAVWVQDFARLLWTGRLVTVMLGVGVVWATFWLGTVLFGRRVGWIAGALTAVSPLPVLLGHYLTTDIPAAFFSTVCLACAASALRAVDQNEPSRSLVRWIMLGSIAAGAAVGTKYNSLPVLLSLAVPLWAAARKAAPGCRPHLGLLGAGSVLLAGLTFLLTTPGALLETPLFLRDVAYELGRNREGQGLIFAATPPSLLYHLGISLPVGLEWPLYLLSLAGAGWSLHRRRPQDALLWLFLLPTVILLATAERKFVRYVAPLIPVLVVLAARAADTGLRTRFSAAWRLAIGAATAVALASTVAHLGVLGSTDARDQAAVLLREQAAPADLVALASDPWYYTPPLDPTAGSVKVSMPYGGPPVWDRSLLSGEERPDVQPLGPVRVLAPRSLQGPRRMVPEGPLPVQRLREYQPEWVITTDYEYEDPLRVRRARADYDDAYLQLYDALQQEYQLEREIRPRPALFGLTWWSRSIPPHDWRYFMPAVRIYRRKVAQAVQS